MITRLEPDTLECEVKWALGSITKNKASGGDGIPDELFQILKDDATKANLEIFQYASKSALATGLEEVSFHSNPKCSNYCTTVLTSHTTKEMPENPPSYASSVCEPRTSRFRKGRGIRDPIANICWIIKNARALQENIYFCFIDYTKALDCVDHNKL